MCHGLYIDYYRSNRQLTSRQDQLGLHQKLEKSILDHLDATIRSSENQIAALSKGLLKAAEGGKSTIIRKWQTKNPDVVLGVSEALSNIALQEGKNRLTEFMLNSLFFPQLPERHTRIAKAHTATFDWILNEKEPCKSDSYSNYVQWLLGDSNNGLYWITGKPGSGKSTLMRYLYDDQRTKSYLRRWSHPQKVLISSCFFWNSGDVLQKSLIGLLRSLLYELLKQRPEEISVAMPWRCQMFELEAPQTALWTVSELLKALERVIESMENRWKVCFFIDGLDEFEGDEAALTEIIDLFCKISEKKHVKVCLSSRPWLVFEDAFQFRPSLQLQDLTRNDIRKYVQVEVAQNKKFLELQTKNFQKCTNLINELVDKAAGVFLWVHLVVRSLLQGLRNEDRIKDLHRRLDMIPADLSEYFGQMMTTLEPFYLEEAIELFDVALKEDHSLLTYSYIREEDTALDSAMIIKTISKAEVKDRLKATTRRINSRCKGLLEVYQSKRGFKANHKYVGFLHRTVKDFLVTQSTTMFMEKHRNKSLDVNISLCRAFIATIKSLDYSKESEDYDAYFQWALGNLFKYARQFEIQNGEALVSILDELYEVFAEIYQRLHQPNVEEDQRWFSSCDVIFRENSYDSQFWMLVLAANLLLYAKIKLRERRADLPTPFRPLLDCALRRGEFKYELLSSSEPGSIYETCMSVEIIDLLLAKGANPNELWSGNTVWSHFLHKWSLFNKDLVLKELENLWKIVRSLVQYGAHVSLEDKVSREYHGKRTETELLGSMFGHERLRELLLLAKSSSMDKNMRENSSDYVSRLNGSSKRKRSVDSIQSLYDRELPDRK